MKALMRASVLILALIASASAAAETDDSGATIKWSYLGTTGPSHWGMLNSDFELCDAGKSQSPVNIGRDRVPAVYSLKIDYHQSQLYIADDINTSLQASADKTIVTSDHGLQINIHDKNKEALSFNDKEYELIQFHFHSPSETLWHKQAFPLEIHFVHQGKSGLLVLVVLVKAGSENELLQQIINHMPEKEHVEVKVPGVKINPMELLPDNQRYYSFSGSLTTPPCTEGVQWVVMPQPVTASTEQILKIRQAAGGTNARPVQPMNGRILYYALPKN